MNHSDQLDEASSTSKLTNWLTTADTQPDLKQKTEIFGGLDHSISPHTSTIPALKLIIIPL